MLTKPPSELDVLNLRVGELVEVRSEPEILATLDENGELESLPFMPEMLQFCGQRFRVDKLALKLCDTIDWTGMYRMRHAVHLQGVRCDGQAHGGCQAGCLVYWKEAWLKRVEASGPQADSDGDGVERGGAPAAGQQEQLPRCTRTELIARAHNQGATAPSGEETYSCQATELIRAAPERIPSWDLRQYVLDVRSGNATTLAMIRSLCVGLFNEFQDLSRKVLPERLRLWGGRRFPFIEGKLKRTPEASLGLEPGELVRVKSKEAIVQTLDVHNRNRGMSFDAEMLKYCGRQARVLRRVEQIIDERSGKLMRFKNPCIVLEDVICTSDYHRLCPRGIYPYWREIWLERVE
jgi:hypothetical protein